MILNKLVEKNVSAGDWVLCESSFTDRIYSYPAEVVKVVGQRIYIRRPQRNREGVIEDWIESYKSCKSVREVVVDEGHGMRMYEAERSAYEAYKLAFADLYHAFIQSRDVTLASFRSENEMKKYEAKQTHAEIHCAMEEQGNPTEVRGV